MLEHRCFYFSFRKCKIDQKTYLISLKKKKNILTYAGWDVFFSQKCMLIGEYHRTTINIKDDLMDALLALTKAKTKTKAVELSI